MTRWRSRFSQGSIIERRREKRWAVWDVPGTDRRDNNNMWTTWPRTKRKWRDSGSSRSGRKPGGGNRDGFRFIYSVVLAACMTAQEARSAKCPPPDTMPGCPCYNFEDGLFLECAGATEESLRTALSGVIHAAEGEGTCTLLQYIKINKGLRFEDFLLLSTGIRISWSIFADLFEFE